jgi:hypothetical protein
MGLKRRFLRCALLTVEYAAVIIAAGDHLFERVFNAVAYSAAQHNQK